MIVPTIDTRHSVVSESTMTSRECESFFVVVKSVCFWVFATKKVVDVNVKWPVSQTTQSDVAQNVICAVPQLKHVSCS